MLKIAIHRDRRPVSHLKPREKRRLVAEVAPGGEDDVEDPQAHGAWPWRRAGQSIPAGVSATVTDGDFLIRQKPRAGLASFGLREDVIPTVASLGVVGAGAGAFPQRIMNWDNEPVRIGWG